MTAVLVLLASCSLDDNLGSLPEPVPTRGVTSLTSSSTSASVDRLPTNTATVRMGDVVGFEWTTVVVGDTQLRLAVADTPDLRSRGLMAVEDLGDLEGMLFTWGGETSSSAFTMRNTLIPLDIAFFDQEGGLVGNFSMVPCDTADCPVYPPSGPYAYAIEVPAGRFANLGPEDRLTFGG